MNCNHCLFYVAGLLAAFAYDNISYKKVATQSHTSTALNSEASYAVDGSISTCTRTLEIGLTSPQKTVWWKVDLGGFYSIYSINILFKNFDGYVERQKGRFAGFSLYVSNADVSTAADIKASTLCYKDGPQLPPLIFTTVCTESARYVIFYNERLDGVVYPTRYIIVNVVTELCEIIVQGVSKKLETASKKVSGEQIRHWIKSIANHCHWTASSSEDDGELKQAKWASVVNHVANKHENHSSKYPRCEHAPINDEKQWIKEGCNNASVYGSYCDTPCPTNCKDSTCHIQSGTCFTCKPGWTGIYCNTKCKEGWYGVNCNQQCSGHCRDGAICNHVTGLCDGGCEVGWTGYLCDKACDDGTYGYHCVNNCSGHCLNNSPCNKETGHCDRGCNPGYTNGDCNKVCSAGQFGFDCSNRCSGHCINNVPCDHVSGVCQSGCQDGFLGTRCAKTCIKGYFGTNCSQMCSSNCKPDTCRHTDGWCTCTAGWTGDNCTTACVQFYGENCLYPCSLQCYNNTCDRFNGRCLLGCEYGFYGELCNREIGFKIQNTSCSILPTIGLSVSLLINLIFIVCGILLYRRNTTIKMKASGNLLSCCKRSIYKDIVVKTEEASTYQELDLSDSAYQNTTLR